MSDGAETQQVQVIDRRQKADYHTCPRYDKHELSADQIADIAEAAAQRAVVIARENFYKDVGQSVVSKLFIIIGMTTVAIYSWLRSKGVL